MAARPAKPTRPARATMREVAALAGVSLKTVSRVINEEPNVRSDVRDRVQAAAARLDYSPNQAASQLRRSGRTGVIGALVQDLSNSFSGALLRALEDTARRHDTVVLTASLDEGAHRERSLVHSFATRRIDGLVLMPATERQDYLASELRAGMPAVFVDRRPSGVDADSVTVDNVAGARVAAAHLLDQGHRRIAILVDLPTIPTAAAREAGFVDAYAARGLRPDPRLVARGLRSTESAYEAVLELMDLAEAPTAIFTARNLLSSGAVRALRELGLQHRVAIVGFDDFPLADLLDPPLTVIRQDVARIGSTVGRILFERIAGDTSPPQHIVLTPTLVCRGSGEIPPPG